MKPPDKLYRFHVDNLRAVSRGLDDVLAAGRHAVATRRDAATHVRLYAFLMGAWSECRLLKLLYEPAAFSDDDRRAVIQLKALERWRAVVERAFRRHSRLSGALKPPGLPTTAHLRLGILLKVLEDDLRSVITLRNKLAHGQWIYPLNESLDDVAQPEMDALRKENLLSLIFKRALIEAVCGAVNDLGVSQRTFDRDFDEHFRLIEQTRVNIARRDYEKWAGQLRARYEQGQSIRKAILGG